MSKKDLVKMKTQNLMEGKTFHLVEDKFSCFSVSFYSSAVARTKGSISVGKKSKTQELDNMKQT